MLTWSWPTDLGPYATHLADMLAASIRDDGILGYTEEPTAAQRTAFADGLVRLVAEGGGHVLVGEDADGPAAMCVLRTTSMPNGRHIADVSKAYLDPRVRGTTAVHRLVAEVCDRAGDIGVELFTIDVREGSPAHRVWSRFGFTTYGVLEDYVRVREVSHRGHYMSCPVRSLADTARAALSARAA
ncbi:hypothetical protein [Streptomyces sp. P17]|uniref:hypothetical protein n=1 Tax=Streptomyces sp. P17 TaxID=3074716 RepID=UPI0028F43EA7|nr:hypothetical protein [Streptomyces sp. P17]MDT9698129.1 hypothetical protein [Streptomyces sp. P17]